MRRAMVVTACLALGGCLLFNERPRQDVSDVSGADASTGDDASTATPDSGTAPVIGSAGDPVCEMVLPPENDCTGPGGTIQGRSEEEPNQSPSPESVFVGDDTTTVVCGQVTTADPDAFTFTVGNNDCWEVTFVSDTATVHVHGPGIDKAASGGGVFQFNTTSAGKVAIDVGGVGPYRFSIR